MPLPQSLPPAQTEPQPPQFFGSLRSQAPLQQGCSKPQLVAGPHWPLALHVSWAPASAQAVWAGAHTPVHAPPMHVWSTHALPAFTHPPATHFWGCWPAHCSVAFAHPPSPVPTDPSPLPPSPWPPPSFPPPLLEPEPLEEPELLPDASIFPPLDPELPPLLDDEDVASPTPPASPSPLVNEAPQPVPMATVATAAASIRDTARLMELSPEYHPCHLSVMDRTGHH